MSLAAILHLNFQLLASSFSMLITNWKKITINPCNLLLFFLLHSSSFLFSSSYINISLSIFSHWVFFPKIFVLWYCWLTDRHAQSIVSFPLRAFRHHVDDSFSSQLTRYATSYYSLKTRSTEYFRCSSCKVPRLTMQLPTNWWSLAKVELVNRPWLFK